MLALIGGGYRYLDRGGRNAAGDGAAAGTKSIGAGFERGAGDPYFISGGCVLRHLSGESSGFAQSD